MQISGKVIFITDKEDKSKQAGKQFFVQDVGIETKDEVNGTTYKNVFKFQAKGDDTAKLESVNVGDEVKVEGSIKCSSFKKKPEVALTLKNPDHLDIIVNLQLDDIAVTKKATPAVTSGTEGNNAGTNTTKSTYNVAGIDGVTFTVGTKPEAIPEGFVWNDAKGIIEKSDLPF